MKYRVQLLFRYLAVGLICCLAPAAQSESIKSADRLERYLALTRTDPLYAWPAVDLSQMAIAIEALKSSRDEIAAQARQYSEAQRQRIERALYPTDYLKEMIALERKRRDLSTDPKSVADYQAQILRTIDAHAAYLTMLRKALEATAEESPHKGLAFHFGRSTFDHFIAGIDAYQVSTTIQKNRAIDRWNCYRGETTKDCEQPRWPVLRQNSEIVYDESTFEKAPARITRAIREQGPMGGAIAGPGWAVLEQSDCGAKNSAVPFLLWRFPTASGVSIFRPEIVSDVFVHDHQIDEDSNPYERILGMLGMKGFLFQPHTNLYACPDAAGDSSRLRSMVLMYEYAKSMKLEVSLDASDAVKRKLTDLELAAQEFAGTKILSESAATQFASELLDLLGTFSQAELISVLGKEELGRIESVGQAYRLRTAYLSQDMMNLVFSNTAIGDYAPHAPWNFLEEALFTRNGPELLLGGNNASIFRGNYAQVQKLRSGISPRLLSYRDDLSKQFTAEQFTQILLDGLEAEHRLARFLQRPYLFAQ